MRLFIVCVAGLILGLAAGCSSEETGPLPDVEVKPRTFDAVEQAIAEAKGKVVLIDCWSISCGPCLSSFPALVAKHKKYADDGLVVIGLNLDDADDTPAVEKFLKKTRATFTNLRLIPVRGVEQRIGQVLGLGRGIPHSVLFNKRGERVWAGHPMDDRLPGMIEAELAK
jgi:thiol-disulfide isomerase/thioredoxin